MSGWFIYFITRLDSLQFIIYISLVLGLVALVAGCVVWPLAANDNNTKVSSIAKHIALKVALPIVIVFGILATLTPSTKEMAAIYLIPKIVNNEQVQQLPNNALEFLNSELRQWMKDTLSPESSTKDSD